MKDTHTQSHTYEQTDAQVSEANDEEKKNTQTQPKHKTNERKTYVTYVRRNHHHHQKQEGEEEEEDDDEEEDDCLLFIHKQ